MNQPQQSQQQSQMISGASPFQKPSSGFVLKNYTMGQVLGQGSFGKVIRATHDPTGIQVAIKVISKQKIQQHDMMTKVEREISIMQMFDHPHVIKLYETITTPTDIYLVMELAECGELFNYITTRKQIDEAKSRYYFQQFISAVDYLHRQAQISHRDLKSENTLINKFDNLKISDFGLSNVMLEGDFLKTSCGSPNYAAPEVISGQQYLGCPADVWSAGCLLYTLMVGKLPFDDPYVPTLFRKIRNGEYTIPDFVSPLGADLIRGMLQVSVEKRFTVEMIVSHEWFQMDLSPNLKKQFEQGYESRYGLIDEQKILNKVNQCMNTNYKLPELQELLQQQRTKHEACVTYRLLYDTEYEQIIQMIQAQHLLSTQAQLQIPLQERVHTPIENEDFKGVSYETFAKNQKTEDKRDDAFLKRAFYFGIKLCGVSAKTPSELMTGILNKVQQAGYKWRLGGITAYKYYDQNKQKDLVTLKLDGNKTKNPYQFSLRLQQPKNYLEYELIIGACVYVAHDAKGEQQYILDLRKVTGEVTMFLYQAGILSELLSDGK
ncbi:Kinase [Hexamita inflata]|uniref:CAMK CAMKL n=1 Tax=Hexamita inflata TaxID=28002 RepID=A0AA86UNZ6_9EUKA|nr:CAMK CAMKL [Hexamita inflata]CAI9964617.1 CAMK CAMKL [Hexamita inflata]